MIWRKMPREKASISLSAPNMSVTIPDITFRQTVENYTFYFTDASDNFVEYEVTAKYEKSSGWTVTQSLVDKDDIDVGLVFSQKGTDQLQVSVPIVGTLSWDTSSSPSNNTSRIEIIGRDVVAPIVADRGAYVSVGEGTFTEMSGGNATSYNSVQLSGDTVNLQPDTKIAKLVTLQVSDAPNCNSENIDKIAFEVSKGKTDLGGSLTVRGKSDFKDDVSVKGTITSDTLKIGTSKALSGYLTGKIAIGSSGSKLVSTNLLFPKELSTAAYIICGTVVSNADNSSDMYSVNFVNLSTTGCVVKVYNLVNDNWSDISLSVHYQITF